MSDFVISGIQQVGIGVSNLNEAWRWYRKNFGIDIRVFEEEATANLMKSYTGGKARNRHAAMALNLQGGGGFEIWQYTERIPEASGFEIQLGDLGIFAIKIKSKNVKNTFEHFKSQGINLLGELRKDLRGEEYFFMRDPYGNLFQVINGEDWFREEKKLTGSAYGAIIGTSNMKHSLKFYSSILGYDHIVYDETKNFDDFASIPGGDSQLRRVLLFHSKERKGGFSRLFGASYIELVSSVERKPRKIFEGRFWGDLGFIHLCYDIHGMQNLKRICKKEGFPFKVDSFEDHNDQGFDIGEASGHFAYVEDPDGTLIEFVETLKLPLIKKIGFYMNLKDRYVNKAMPNWLLKALRFNRVKD